MARPTLDAVDVWMVGLVIVWGTAFAAIKALGEVLDPFQIMWFRFLPFIILYGGWLVVRKRAVLRSIPLQDWWRFLVLGALGVLGYHIPLNWGLQDRATGVEVTGATGAILVATTPLWTLFIATLSGRESPGPRRALGSVVAFAGVAVVVLWGQADGEGLTLAARAAVIILAPILWASYNVLGKPLATRYGGRVFTGISFSMGTILLIPYGLSVGLEPLRGMTGLQWFWLAYLGVAATVAGYAVWNFALERRLASDVTSFIYMVPVVATIAGWLLLREAVTVWFIVGAGMVLGGVAMINRARLEAARRAAVEAP